MYTLFFYDKIFLSDEERLTVRFYSSYRLYYDIKGRVAQSVGHLTRKSGVLGSIPGLATYFRFSFRFFKKKSCLLYNFDTVSANFAKLGTNIKHDWTTCRD